MAEREVAKTEDLIPMPEKRDGLLNPDDWSEKAIKALNENPKLLNDTRSLSRLFEVFGKRHVTAYHAHVYSALSAIGKPDKALYPRSAEEQDLDAFRQFDRSYSGYAPLPATYFNRPQKQPQATVEQQKAALDAAERERCANRVRSSLRENYPKLTGDELEAKIETKVSADLKAQEKTLLNLGISIVPTGDVFRLIQDDHEVSRFPTAEEVLHESKKLAAQVKLTKFKSASQHVANTLDPSHSTPERAPGRDRHRDTAPER